MRTFQLVQLFKDLTVLENVQVGCHLHTKGGVLSALLRTALRRAEQEAEVRAQRASCSTSSASARRPTCAPSTLPYGQQRLLEVARALAAEPRLLLLDEPAAGLNPRRDQARSPTLIRAIAERGITVLLIEHDMSLVMSIARPHRRARFRPQDRRGHAGRDARSIPT